MDNHPTKSGMEQSTADTITRNLWVAFNNVGLYGFQHPLTMQALNTLIATLSNVLADRKAVALHYHQQVLYCEDLRIDPRNFGNRLFTRFSDAGVQSISFLAGVTIAELIELVGILNTPRTYPTVESMSQSLTQKNAIHIRFNMIRYQKIMDGQMVVEETVGNAVKTLVPGIDSETDADMLKRVAMVAPKQTAVLAGSIAQRVEELRHKVDSRIGSGAVSSDEMISALSALNKDIAQQLKLERASGTIQKTDGKVLDTAEKLTFETIVRIVREEYSAGTVSPERLAKIIRRCIPDVADLKRLLPQLKSGLLAAGMTMEDYLKLMEELAGELEQEGLTDMLRRASAEIGMSVDEIVKNLKKNPETAVNLILLSSEIQSMIGLDSKQLQSLMGEYLERVTNELLVASGNSEQAKQVEAVQQALTGVHEALLTGMAESGADPETIKAVGSGVAEKIRLEMTRLKNVSDAGPAGTPDARNNQYVESKDTTVPESQANAPAKKGTTLPKGVLGSKSIKVFLDREVKRCRRYKTELSCLLISSIMPAGGQNGLKEAPEELLNDILSQACDKMGKTLRDLDLIGLSGSLEDNTILVILSMTGSTGAEVVRKRLLTLFETISVQSRTETVTPNFCISLSVYNSETMPDLSSYIKAMMANHRASMKNLSL